MKNRNLLLILVISISCLSAVAALAALLSREGPGPAAFTSVHGRDVTLYGRGFYRHMSAAVAPQGLAQDIVTLALGIPALIASLICALRGMLRGKLALAGTLLYFLVTYLFYSMMAMFSPLFLLHVPLLSLSFFAFYLSVREISGQDLRWHFSAEHRPALVGGFLVFSGLAIALMWLMVVIPPLLRGEVPPEVEHYTTLVVQALDLSIMLPLSVISGRLLWNRARKGYLYGSVYVIFLALLMTALTAKVLAMHFLGYNTAPAIVIIPLFNVLALLGAAHTLRELHGTARAVPAT